MLVLKWSSALIFGLIKLLVLAFLKLSNMALSHCMFLCITGHFFLKIALVTVSDGGVRSTVACFEEKGWPSSSCCGFKPVWEGLKSKCHFISLSFFTPSFPFITKEHSPPRFLTHHAYRSFFFQTSSVLFFLWDSFFGPHLLWCVIIFGGTRVL